MNTLLPDRGTLKIEPWISTYTGHKIDMYEPQESEINIEDIARGLSQCNRFGGQLRYPVSVAYHSAVVAKFAPDNLKFAALMHDASEAYLVDIPTPIKQLFPVYYEIEERLMRVIAKRFQFNYDDVKLTRQWDWAACCTEARQLQIGGVETWKEKLDFLDYEYKEITPSHAYSIFMIEFDRLRVQ